MIQPYLFGNTSVRSTIRFPEGLRILEKSKFNGNLNSKENELRFAKELANAGVVKMITEDDSLGRKWRSAFDKMGFITKSQSRGAKLRQNLDVDPFIVELNAAHQDIKLSGRIYELTPQGKRLATANTVYEMQDTILRAMLAIQIENKESPGQYFKPFIFTLQVMVRLIDMGELKGLDRFELSMLLFYTDHNLVDEAAKEITAYRRECSRITGKRKKEEFRRLTLQSVVDKFKIKYETIISYGDPNFKYMLTTGLFNRQGRRLAINEEKASIIDEILKSEPNFISDPVEYYYSFWKGYPLPTDNRSVLIQEIKRLNRKVNNGNLLEDLEKQSIPDLRRTQVVLEIADSNNREVNYAIEQSNKQNIEDIINYLKMINGDKKNGIEYINARDDMPAFFEWAVWRSFLAIDSLINKPNEARGFKVDQDFYPAGNAPGGRPDIKLEFEHYTLIVEVTLTSSSRQEAAEAEPVRRHVAQIQEKEADYNKPVYGLFIAPSIDSNTAEMFRVGLWYHSNEPKFVNIVPITLKQFISIMESYKDFKFTNEKFERLIERCLIPRNTTVPLWLGEINQIIRNFH